MKPDLAPPHPMTSCGDKRGHRGQAISAPVSRSFMLSRCGMCVGDNLLGPERKRIPSPCVPPTVPRLGHAQARKRRLCPACSSLSP